MREALEKAVFAAADDAETLDALNKLGAQPGKLTSAGFQALFQREEPRLIKMIDDEKARSAKKS